jgi:hypothetical protein
MTYIHKYIGVIIFLYAFLSFGVVNSMILDENYSNNGKKSLLEVINNDIKTAYTISLLNIKNLEDTSNINIQTIKLRNFLDKDLLQNILLAADSIKSSDVDENLKESVLNLNYLINSIHDKTDMILGGASPIAMAFYSEEIIKQFKQIYDGIDKNNNNKIENENGEGCLNFINSLYVNNK